jgi:hypothetical protein
VSLDWLLLSLRVLAVALVYVFLGAAIYVIWRELGAVTSGAPHQGVASCPAGDDPSARLVVVAAGDSSLKISDSLTIFAPATLGRAEDNQVVLPDACVSARHVRIDARDGEWWLTDLDSRNGTQLNGLAVTKPVPLADGDVIGVSQVQLRFELSGGRALSTQS